MAEHPYASIGPNGQLSLTKSGTVVDVTTSGTAVVLASGPGPASLLGFTFDKLEDYRGQTANAYGVTLGAPVEFEERDGRIFRVRLQKAGKRAG